MGSPQKEKEICQTEAVIQIGISRAGNPQMKVGDKPRVIIQGKGVYISPAVKFRYPEVIGILKQAPGVLAFKFRSEERRVGKECRARGGRWHSGDAGCRPVRGDDE